MGLGLLWVIGCALCIGCMCMCRSQCSARLALRHSPLLAVQAGRWVDHISYSRLRLGAQVEVVALCLCSSMKEQLVLVLVLLGWEELQGLQNY